MHQPKSRLFLSLISFLLFLNSPSYAQESSAAAHSVLKTFAVLELFTAEGCGSCIDADEILSKLEKNAEKAGTEIYFLNYHVPYWDQLGWKDQYASKVFETYQDFYNSYLPVPKSYTPQIIVNGINQFTGTDEMMLRRSLEDELGKNKPSYIANLKAEKSDSAHVLVKCELREMPSNSQLQIALVEKDLPETTIKSGENEGIQNVHYSAVRILETISVPKTNNEITLNFNFPKKEKKYTVIAFLQNKTLCEIYSVDQVKVKLK